MLDTGAENSILFENQALKVATVDKALSYRSGPDGEKIILQSCKIHKMCLSTLAFNDIHMDVMPANNPGLQDIGGMLGGDILKNFIVVIDYRRKQLILYDPKTVCPLPSTAAVVPIRIWNNLLEANVILDNRLRLIACIDTGSSDTLASISTIKSLLKSFIQMRAMPLGPWFKTKNVSKIQLESLGIGPISWTTPIITVMDRTQPLNGVHNTGSDYFDRLFVLGNDFLSQFRLTIDYKNSRIILDPYEDAATETPSYCIQEGIYYLNHSSPQLAISKFKRALLLEPEFALQAYSKLSYVYSKLHQYHTAIDYCSKIISLSPNESIGYSNRAAVYADSGQYKEAIDDCNKAIILNPVYTSPYMNRGVAHKNLGQYLEAVGDYTKVIEINPQLTDAYKNRAWLYGKLGEHKKQHQDLNKAKVFESKVHTNLIQNTPQRIKLGVL